MRLALCGPSLSWHLGVICRLIDDHQLQHVTSIVCDGAGIIAAALLWYHWRVVGKASKHRRNESKSVIFDEATTSTKPLKQKKSGLNRFYDLVHMPIVELLTHATDNPTHVASLEHLVTWVSEHHLRDVDIALCKQTHVSHASDILDSKESSMKHHLPHVAFIMNSELYPLDEQKCSLGDYLLRTLDQSSTLKLHGMKVCTFWHGLGLRWSASDEPLLLSIGSTSVKYIHEDHVFTGLRAALPGKRTSTCECIPLSIQPHSFAELIGQHPFATIHIVSPYLTDRPVFTVEAQRKHPRLQHHRSKRSISTDSGSVGDEKDGDKETPKKKIAKTTKQPFVPVPGAVMEEETKDREHKTEQRRKTLNRYTTSQKSLLCVRLAKHIQWATSNKRDLEMYLMYSDSPLKYASSLVLLGYIRTAQLELSGADFVYPVPKLTILLPSESKRSFTIQKNKHGSRRTHISESSVSTLKQSTNTGLCGCFSSVSDD